MAYTNFKQIILNKLLKYKEYNIVKKMSEKSFNKEEKKLQDDKLSEEKVSYCFSDSTSEEATVDDPILKQLPKVTHYSPWGQPIDEEYLKRLDKRIYKYDIFSLLEMYTTSFPKRKITYVLNRTTPYNIDEDIELERTIIERDYVKVILEFGTEQKEFLDEVTERRLKGLERMRERKIASNIEKFLNKDRVKSPQIIFVPEEYIEDEGRGKYLCC